MFFFKYLLPLKQSFVIINKYGCKLSLIKQTKIKTVLVCYTTLSNKQEQSYTILFLWIQIKKKPISFYFEWYKWEWSYYQKHNYKLSSSKIQILYS